MFRCYSVLIILLFPRCLDCNEQRRFPAHELLHHPFTSSSPYSSKPLSSATAATSQIQHKATIGRLMKSICNDDMQYLYIYMYSRKVMRKLKNSVIFAKVTPYRWIFSALNSVILYFTDRLTFVHWSIILPPPSPPPSPPPNPQGFLPLRLYLCISSVVTLSSAPQLNPSWLVNPDWRPSLRN